MSGLTRDDIDHILKLVDGSDFDELKLEMGDLKLELRKPEANAARISAPVSAPPTPAPEAQQGSAPTTNSASSGTAVPAPLLGIFYHASKPGDPPFVAVGDEVTPETVIGIIEVMKLMNQVQAGVTGRIIAISAPNGELVEHGQALIRVQPD